ncbi:Cdc7p-Dbf4p kinase complex regulatory subunit [Coemansia sp. RSA 2322]|nr:Cdc7p-Dbf4p kinase complex regulatory subunit [Coemansia sp. RSA 2322]
MVCPPTPQSAGLGKRNPLQAITEQEKQRANNLNAAAATPTKTKTTSTGNSAAGGENAAAAAAEQQRLQRARVAEWVFAYRRAFPSFVFYFEGVDEDTVQRLSAPVRSLGASVETFFSAQTVTHVIVENIDVADDENSVASGSHVVSLAKRFQLKIWDLEKLEKRVLAFLLPGYNAANAQSASVTSAKRKLNEAFSAEKLYAMRHKTFEGTSVAHCVDFYYFKYFYVLVEDATHLHRPAIVEDYRPPEPGRDPPWPKLYMVPTGRCPFVQYEDPTTSSKGSDSDGDDNKENLTPEPEPTLPTAQLLSKTPASRIMQTPRRNGWTPPGVERASNDLLGHPGPPKPFATVQPIRACAAATREAADYLLTPTRASRGLPAELGPPRPVRPMDASLMMDSNASGIAQSLGVTSTSTAFHPGAIDSTLQQSLLQNLNGGRVTHLARLEQPVVAPRLAGARASGRVPPVPRTKKPRVAVRRPAVARPGYCENCHAKYDDMIEHIKTPQHRRFANNERNWVELDSLLSQVQRPVLQQSLDSEPGHAASSRDVLYALSSDDPCMSAPVPVDDSTAHNRPTHPADSSVTASAPAVLASNWTIPTRLFAGRQFGPSYPSPHMLASGRFSAGTTTDGMTMPSGPAPAASAVTPTTAGTVDLVFPESNSPCISSQAGGDHLPPGFAALSADLLPTTPVPRRGIAAASTSIESLVSSLETPRFGNDALRDQYADGATLFADGLSRQCQQHGALFETPTRASTAVVSPTNALAVADRGAVGARFNTSAQQRTLLSHDAYSRDSIGGATLVQPPRVKPKCCADYGDENAAPVNSTKDNILSNDHRLARPPHSQARPL